MRSVPDPKITHNKNIKFSSVRHLPVAASLMQRRVGLHDGRQMQKTELAQCDQLTSSHVTNLTKTGVFVVMVTTQFPYVVVTATVPHARPSKKQVTYTKLVAKTKSDACLWFQDKNSYVSSTFVKTFVLSAVNQRHAKILSVARDDLFEPAKITKKR